MTYCSRKTIQILNMHVGMKCTAKFLNTALGPIQGATTAQSIAHFLTIFLTRTKGYNYDVWGATHA